MNGPIATNADSQQRSPLPFYGRFLAMVSDVFKYSASLSLLLTLAEVIALHGQLSLMMQKDIIGV